MTNPTNPAKAEERRQRGFALAQALGAVLPLSLSWPDVKRVAAVIVGWTAADVDALLARSQDHQQ